MTPIVKATLFSGAPSRSNPKTLATSCSRLPLASPSAVAKPAIFCQTVIPKPQVLSGARENRCRRPTGPLIPQVRTPCQGSSMSATPNDEVLIRREGRAGRITINRPQALNALPHAMVAPIWNALLAWQNDAGVELVLLDGSGDRALCAGGDVRALYDSRSAGSGAARAFWRDEYRLNALIGRYHKPYVAIQDGIVMGGGIGLSAHARHRIVTERSRLAMPETGIGLIPDVGGSWLLAHAPGEAGLYLGLTGAEMNAADAIYAGFSDVFVPAGSLGELKARLLDPKGGAIGEVLKTLTQAAGRSRLADRAADIDQILAADNLATILDRLQHSNLDWRHGTHLA